MSFGHWRNHNNKNNGGSEDSRDNSKNKNNNDSPGSCQLESTFGDSSALAVDKQHIGLSAARLSLQFFDPEDSPEGPDTSLYRN